MILISSYDKDFPFEEAQELFNENKKYFPLLKCNFIELIKMLKGNCWAVLINNQLYGIIYFEVKNKKWFLSGFSKRKVYKYVADAIIKICNHYFGYLKINKIYSETQYKHAKLALMRAGFKERNNLWEVQNPTYQHIKAV